MFSLRLVDDGQWPLAYGYDEAGRLTEDYQGFASLFYGYDSAGNLTQILDSHKGNGNTATINNLA